MTAGASVSATTPRHSGPIVSDQALYQALSEGWIAGAGRDDIEEPPLSAVNAGQAASTRRPRTD